jgi:hypothetical protein
MKVGTGLAALLLSALALGGVARADVGVMSTSRAAGAPGDQARVTLGCGFCFPPCKGPKGEKHPAGFDHGPCMIGTHGAPPPDSFGISLVPLASAPKPRPCGPDALCSPQAPSPPSNAPYSYLGRATPPPRGNNPEHGAVPRYSLTFRIPRLAPGTYAYVIWCDACVKGSGGSLVADPGGRRWRLHVRSPGRAASASTY